MAGIRSIGWWIPRGRRSAAEIIAAYGLGPNALASMGLRSRAVAGDGDHPSTMGARATRAALDGAGLQADDLDLLIFAGVTRDWPAPWVAAFGVLRELGATRVAGFDLASRCAGVIDALWLAKVLIDSGTHRRVAVCCAERLDHLLDPARRPEMVTEVAYGAGAAAAIVTPDAGNEILAFSSFTNPDLGAHRGAAPVAGGTRVPFDQVALLEGLHRWKNDLTFGDLERIAAYEADADRHNYTQLYRRCGFERIDFVACSPLYPEPQLRVLEELGVDRTSTLFTIPHLGHIGPADLLLILGVAVLGGRSVGQRVVLSTRTAVYANALAVLGRRPQLGIAVGGEGIDPALWGAPASEARPC
jgi:3-oxoacyl-[acyl-carrier-protein] synthase-3